MEVRDYVHRTVEGTKEELSALVDFINQNGNWEGFVVDDQCVGIRGKNWPLRHASRDIWELRLVKQ